MDDATKEMLWRLGGQLAIAAILTYRAGGREEEAAEIEAILTRADATWRDVLAKATAPLPKPPTP